MSTAEHCAREDAGRTGTIVGSEVDRIEALAMADAATGVEVDEGYGAWLLGEAWGVVDE